MNPFYKLFCLIYPEKCPYCDAFIKSEAIACDRCLEKLDEVQKPVMRGVGGFRCVSSFFYGGRIRRMILRIKYHDRVQYIPQVAAIMAGDIRTMYGDDRFDLITYVPMHKIDQKKRKYNQAERLAKALSKLLDIPCVKTLDKVKHTKKQQRLKYAQRKTNLKGAFKVSDKELIKDKSILIVDDIVTTGITLTTCCKTITRSKPHLICCATIANASHHLPDKAII